jgi:ABC-type multidrug transport system ATPase subunit
VTIFGPNGAGKTTLIRILSTLTRPTDGEFSINNCDLKDDAGEIRQQIGMLSHAPFLYDELSPYENLKFFGKMFNLEPGKIHNRVKGLLREVGLSHRTHDRVGTFSRGMKQRVAIARAIIHKPKVLLLDEPYTGLDQNATTVLNEILKDFKSSSGTIVLVTHDLERGLKLSDRIAILSEKKIVFEGKSKDLTIKELKSIYQRYSK